MHILLQPLRMMKARPASVLARQAAATSLKTPYTNPSELFAQ